MPVQVKSGGSRGKVAEQHSGAKDSMKGGNKAMKDKGGKGGGASKAKGNNTSSSNGGTGNGGDPNHIPPEVAATVASAPSNPINAAVVNPDVGICFDFTKGRCQRGALCRFSHDPQKIEAAAAADKNGICFDFTRGQCNRGSSCRFSHDLNLLNQQNSNKSSGICFDFINGKCQRGAACRFSHDMSSAQSQSSSSKSNGVCFDFTKGRCQRGAACRFSHDLSNGGVPMGIGLPGAHPQPVGPGPNGMAIQGAPPLPSSQQVNTAMISNGAIPVGSIVSGASNGFVAAASQGATPPAPRESPPTNFAAVAAAQPPNQAQANKQAGYNPNAIAPGQNGTAPKIFPAQGGVPNFAAAVGGPFASNPVQSSDEGSYKAGNLPNNGMAANGMHSSTMPAFNGQDADNYPPMGQSRPKALDRNGPSVPNHLQNNPIYPPLQQGLQAGQSKTGYERENAKVQNGQNGVGGNNPAQSAELYSGIAGQNVQDLGKRPGIQGAVVNGSVQNVQAQPPLPNTRIHQSTLPTQPGIRPPQPPQLFQQSHFLYQQQQQQQQYEQADHLVSGVGNNSGFEELTRPNSLAVPGAVQGSNSLAHSFGMHNGQGVQEPPYKQPQQQEQQSQQQQQQSFESHQQPQPPKQPPPQQQMSGSDVIGLQPNGEVGMQNVGLHVHAGLQKSNNSMISHEREEGARQPGASQPSVSSQHMRNSPEGEQPQHVPMSQQPQRLGPEVANFPTAYMQQMLAQSKYAGGFPANSAITYQAQNSTSWQSRIEVPSSDSSVSLTSMPGKKPPGPSEEQVQNGLSSHLQGLMFGRQASDDASTFPLIQTSQQVPSNDRMENGDVSTASQYNHVWSKPSGHQTAQHIPNGARSRGQDTLGFPAAAANGWHVGPNMGKAGDNGMEKGDVSTANQYEHVWSKPSGHQNAQHIPNIARSPDQDTVGFPAAAANGWHVGPNMGKAGENKQPWGPVSNGQQQGKNHKEMNHSFGLQILPGGRNGWSTPADRTQQIKSEGATMDPSILQQLQPKPQAQLHAEQQGSSHTTLSTSSSGNGNYWGGSLFSMHFEQSEQNHMKAMDRWNIWSG